ncbi:MAG TPA: hypothetical protein DDZ91_14535 [Firmicutes bacterium]|jgi:excisionase family DNA binding protein|nr:hypothetical protein [Bacillota bacterium]
MSEPAKILNWNDVLDFLKLHETIKITKNGKWEEYPESLKVKQAAQLLQIGKNQVYELCKCREDFPVVKFGRQYRISKTLLKDWLEQQAKGIV